MTVIGSSSHRPIALVTGASRTAGIGGAIALDLAANGWDVALNYWQPYDDRMPWGAEPEGVDRLSAAIRDVGGRCLGIEADLSSAGAPRGVLGTAEGILGPVTALVLSHCESVDSDIRSTSVESFDRHMAVNARASWLLIREFSQRYKGAFGQGRIVALTSDHTAWNLPYGASKGALDRIVLAAAHELADQGITANVLNPGPVDTGWMTSAERAITEERTPLHRLGTPDDVAAAVTFLCSSRGGWINGQLLRSDGGLSAPG